MRTRFKITRGLLDVARADLRRPHPFAHERIGWVSASISASGDELLILARGYRSLADEDYLRNPTVGAMMSAAGIRKALQWALTERVAIFNVHTHGGIGVPRLSAIDLRESAKFVPDFFKVAGGRAHGALVLSNDAMFGKVWLNAKDATFIQEFVAVGVELTKRITA